MTGNRGAIQITLSAMSRAYSALEIHEWRCHFDVFCKSDATPSNSTVRTPELAPRQGSALCYHLIEGRASFFSLKYNERQRATLTPTRQDLSFYYLARGSLPSPRF
jgi:hypothetical protein